MFETIKEILDKQIHKIQIDDNLSLIEKSKRISKIFEWIDIKINWWYIKMSTHYNEYEIREILKTYTSGDFTRLTCVFARRIIEKITENLLNNLLK